MWLKSLYLLSQNQIDEAYIIYTMRQQGLWFPDAAPNGCVQSVSGPLQVPAYIAQNMDRLSSELMLNMW